NFGWHHRRAYSKFYKGECCDESLFKKDYRNFHSCQRHRKARDWYCELLQLKPTNDFPGGHLYILEMKDLNIVLDSKIYREETILQTPIFHFDTDDIQGAYNYIQSKGIELVTEIQFGHYF